MAVASTTQVICLACGADDLDRRLGDIRHLAEALGGRGNAQTVSGRTAAVRVCVPAANADRFAAALTLAGATQMETAPNIVAPTNMDVDFLVLLTLEPPASGESRS